MTDGAQVVGIMQWDVHGVVTVLYTVCSDMELEPRPYLQGAPNPT